MVFSKVGRGSEGGGKKKSTENQEFWLPRHEPHDQERIPPPGALQICLCVARKQGQVASFQTFLVI